MRASDLAGVPPGWHPLSTTPDDSAPVCSWQDYSRYTLTGRGQDGFEPVKVGGAGFVGSTVDVYATAADALGKFQVDTHAGTAQCESEALRKAFGGSLKTVAARQLATPSLGEHGAAFQFVYSQAKAPKEIYVNVIEFVRGRSVAVIDTTNFDTPGNAGTRLALARAVERRLR